MNDLIPIERGDDGALVVSSTTIAEGAEVEHRAVLQLVRNNVSDFEEFGGVAFEMRPFETAGGTQSRDVAVLNEQQATLLLTYMRNSGPVRTFKKALVRSFYAMAQELAKPKRELTFEEKALEVMGELTARVEDQRKQLEIVKPLAARAVTYSAAAQDIGRQEFAREVCKMLREQLSIDAKFKEVYEFLGRKLNLFIVGDRRDNGHATSHGEKNGWSLTAKGTTEDGHNYATGKLTRKGQDYAWKRIYTYADEHGTIALPQKENRAA